MPIYLLDDSSLVYSEDGRRLFSLDTLATYIWLRFEEGWNQEKIRKDLHVSGKITDTKILEEQIGNLHLLYQREVDQEEATTGHAAVAGTESIPLSESNKSFDSCYKLLDTRFAFRCGSKPLEELVSSYLSPLEIGEAFPEYIVEISEHEEGITLIINQAIVRTKLQFNQILPLLFYQLRSIAAGNIDYLFAVHAAALARGDHCLLFPACSGSGKSTLASMLVTSGFQYLTDELVAVECTDQRIRPMPLGMGIKASGWQEVARYSPGILDLPIQERLDGVQVRYLSVDEKSIACAKGFRISHIIFPRYDAQAAEALIPLSSVDALCALAEAGYYLPQGLNEARLVALLEWLSSCQIYAMTYRNAQQARCYIEQATGLP